MSYINKKYYTQNYVKCFKIGFKRTNKSLQFPFVVTGLQSFFSGFLGF